MADLRLQENDPNGMRRQDRVRAEVTGHAVVGQAV